MFDIKKNKLYSEHWQKVFQICRYIMTIGPLDHPMMILCIELSDTQSAQELIGSLPEYLLILPNLLTISKVFHLT